MKILALPVGKVASVLEQCLNALLSQVFPISVLNAHILLGWLSLLKAEVLTLTAEEDSTRLNFCSEWAIQLKYVVELSVE